MDESLSKSHIQWAHGATNGTNREAPLYQTLGIRGKENPLLSHLVLQFSAIKYCVKYIPFPIPEVNTDNCGEFPNSGVFQLWNDALPDAKMTRSRPCHENDNAHAEQMDQAHVHDLFLRFPLEQEQYVGIMNKIYRTANVQRNYVFPCKTLKKRNFDPLTKRVRRKYTDPQTPVERIPASKVIDTEEMKLNKEKLLKEKKQNQSG